MSPQWYAARETEDAKIDWHAETGTAEKIMWFQQTIRNACGSMGVLHCLLSGEAKKHIMPDSIITKIRDECSSLKYKERAQYLYDSPEFEACHAAVAHSGETAAPGAEDDSDLHFVAFVKGDDGHLYELEGNRKGPLDRGDIGTEDVLSEKALDLGIRRIIKMCGEEDCRYSVTALA